MGSLPLWLLLVIFPAAAAVIWVAGIELSRPTDVIDARFHLGSAFGGLIVLAVATNLPEIAITVSAALAGNLDVAVGNILGGIAIQTVVLVGPGRCSGSAAPDVKPLTYRAASLTLVLEAARRRGCARRRHRRQPTASQPDGRPVDPGRGADRRLCGSIGLLLVQRAGTWPAVAGGRRCAAATRTRRASHASPKPLTGGGSFRTGARAQDPHRRSDARSTVALVRSSCRGHAGRRCDTGTQRARRPSARSGCPVSSSEPPSWPWRPHCPRSPPACSAIRQGDDNLAISDIFGGNAFLPVLFLVATLISGAAVLPQRTRQRHLPHRTGRLLTLVYLVGLIFRPKRRIAGMGIDSLVVLILYLTGIGGLFAVAAS